MDRPHIIGSEYPLCDRFERPITSLRICVTGKCNLRCFYCHREGQKPHVSSLTVEEIKLICSVASGIGVRKVKITGGEPLLRHDIDKVISAISSIRDIEEVSMTSNGILMAPAAADLVRAGLKRANISLPSIDPRVYGDVTGISDSKARWEVLSKVVKGIEAAIAAGLSPVKINMVVLKGLNDHEIPRMIEFSRQKGGVLQLIELQNLGIDRNLYKVYHNDLRALENWLAEHASKIETRWFSQNRRSYRAFGTEIEVVRPMENEGFCAACTKIRVLADGTIKPCLMRTDNTVSIPSETLASRNEAVIRRLFEEAIRRREPFFVSPKVSIR